jgi:branched-chain amino acid transport system substrate-binding protein
MTKPVVKVGFAAPFSGDQAIVGVPMRQCAELAVDELNERNDFPFELILRAEDDGADPELATAVAERFVADQTVLAVVGHKNSGPSAAAAPVYSAAGLPQISPSSTNSQLSQQGYSTFFRLCAHDAVQGEVAAQYATRVLGARRVVIVHDQTDYGLPLAEVVRTAVEGEDAAVVLFEGITEGDTDFSKAVSRIQRLAPELIYFALTEIESSILAGQLRAAGLEALLFGTDGSRESQFLPLAGPAAEGVYQTYAGVDPVSAPAARSFVQHYEARYGAVPVYGAEVYDAVNLTAEALRRAGQADRQALLYELAHIRDFEGATGRIEFEPNGDRREPQVSIWRVIQGDIQMIGLARDLIPEDKDIRDET